MQDRAFGAIIAVALVGEFLDGIPHRAHRGNLRRDLGDMVQRQPFDIPAGAALVLPKVEQPAYAFDREAEIAGPFNEPQDEDIRLCVDAIAAAGTIRGRDQPGRLVIANGLAGTPDACAASPIFMAGFLDKPLAMPTKDSPYGEGQGVWEDAVRCLKQIDLELRLWGLGRLKTCGMSDDKRPRRVAANARQMSSGDSLLWANSR